MYKSNSYIFITLLSLRNKDLSSLLQMSDNVLEILNEPLKKRDVSWRSFNATYTL